MFVYHSSLSRWYAQVCVRTSITDSNAADRMHVFDLCAFWKIEHNHVKCDYLIIVDRNRVFATIQCSVCLRECKLRVLKLY